LLAENPFQEKATMPVLTPAVFRRNGMRDSAYMQREKIFLQVCSCCEMILNRNEIHRECTAHPHKLYALDTHTAICPACLHLSLSATASKTPAPQSGLADKS